MIASDESSSANAMPEQLDHGTSTVQQPVEFSCVEGRMFEAAFQGQETLTLTFAGEQRILQAQAAASGARYVGDSVAFWNKGDEAMIEWDGRSFECLRKG